MSAYQGQTFVESAHLLAKFLIAFALIIGTLREFILQLGQMFLNLMVLFESRHSFVEHGFGGMYILFLRQVAYGNIVRHHHVAVCRLL